MKKIKNKISILVLSVLLFSVQQAYAQSFFSRVTTRTGPHKNEPTVITSDSMDFDITKNVAVFTGNVQVDDANMRILCHKMIVQFEGKAKGINALATGKKESDKSDKKDKSSTDKKDKSEGGGTKVKEIVCIKNVIIIRKLYDEDDKKEGEQKAVAGHAVYDVKTGKITLTENPALIRGEDTLRGEVITYWVDSERVNVRSGKRTASELKIRARSRGDK